MIFSTIEMAIEDIRNGKQIIVVDSQDRENEGDLVMASELVTPEKINFMAKEGRGLICVSLTNERATELDLEPIQNKNTSLHETNFTVSVDARENTTTGISAFDRSETVRVLIDDKSKAKELARPGHI
ncbi:MAG: 3,4-dihydroxy-2-butanone-4-phosphate synthase, partial [Fidelibacterota bacterium]